LPIRSEGTVGNRCDEEEVMSREEFLFQERERLGKRGTIAVVSAKILPWLDGFSSIPDEVVEAAAAVLDKAADAGNIRGRRVHAFADDLHIQVNTLGLGLHHRATHHLAFRAATEALRRAAEWGYGGTKQGTDFFRLSPEAQLSALHVRPLEFPFTERKAETILIAKLINGGVGGFNRMLFNLFFHHDKGSHRRLDGTRFLAVVEHVGDLMAGKGKRRVFAFGDRPEEEPLFLLYPFLKEPLEVRRDQMGDPSELLSLIANPAEWVVSALFAVRGRFASAGGRLQETRHEPVAVVSVEGAAPGIVVESPVVVLRLQSGVPAVGEAHLNLGADFAYTVGGPNGGYHVGVMPVTMGQARVRSDESGTARLVAYTYQSYDNGRIPSEHDVIDLYGQDTAQTEWLQQEAREFIVLMEQHGEFQPRLTAEEAERRARGCAERLDRLFEPIPATDRGETDPVVARANQRSRGETLSDIKADAGGKVGHTTPPTLFVAVGQASLLEAREKGLIRDFRVFAVGDDLHLLMYHGQGVDANDVHLLAFRTFWRQVWVTEIMGYKPYGLAQDLQIGPATKGKRVDDLAEPSERFISLLAETLAEPERSQVTKISATRQSWMQGRGGLEVTKPFAGNVTGQGPGFAELPLADARRVGLLAADKCGPAAFNIPVYHGAGQALTRERFRNRFGQSVAYEIFDVHSNRRVFLDARAHEEDIRTLLGATNLFNVKRLWSLPDTVSRREEVKKAIHDILLAASTEKLALIAGGEYVGKDDPVLLGVDELVSPMFEHMKTGFYMTQGDERGSHYMMLVPKPLGESVATVRSRGLQVGLAVTLRADRLAEVHDVYAGPGYREARIRIDKANARIWRAQGSEFTPVGVGARDVEPAYPLMKVLNRITGEGSTYALHVVGGIQDLYVQVVRAGG
jgi:fructose 1,6-bisphosphate aldolase/phosphatase